MRQTPVLLLVHLALAFAAGLVLLPGWLHCIAGITGSKSKEGEEAGFIAVPELPGGNQRKVSLATALQGEEHSENTLWCCTAPFYLSEFCLQHQGCLWGVMPQALGASPASQAATA